MAEKSKGQNREEQEGKKQDPSGTDLGDMGGSENASANRGGTTDMDSEALTIDKGRAGRIASGVETKRTVTGSDFDGQVSPE